LRALAAALAAACLQRRPLLTASANATTSDPALVLPRWRAAAVVVSFLIVGLFVREAPRVHSYPRIDLIAAPLGRWLASPSLALALKSLALRRFHHHDPRGFRGDQNPYRNIAPTMVWTIAGSVSPMFARSSATSGR